MYHLLETSETRWLVESLRLAFFTIVIFITRVDFLERMHPFADGYYSDARKNDSRYGENVITPFYTQIIQGLVYSLDEI